jgi:hypothetical protein
VAIREELELDISSALASIEEVGAALTAVADQFRQSIFQAVDALAQGIPAFQIPVEVIVASSDLGQVVNQGLSENDGETINTNITGDTSSVQESFEDSLRNAAAQPLDLAPANIEGNLVNAEQLSFDFFEAASGGGETLEFNAELQPEINLEGIQDSITQVFAEPPPIEPEADLSGALADYDAFVDQLNNPVEIPVAVDEGAAEQADKTTEAVKKTEESFDGAAAAVGALAVGAKIGVSALALTAATATGLFVSAVEAEGAVISFNQTLGELAPAIRNVDVNGLNTDLGDLAIQLGSDDEAALGVAQRFGLLGITAGAAADDISTANNQLFAVAANLRATNPALGELDQIASRAGTAFIRGGRAATALGLSLTSQEIRARAAEQTGKELNSAFTQFELFAAGASLASEQFGSAIERNVALAAQNPIIALSNLKVLFADTLEEFGKPLVVPILAILTDLVPVATSVVGVIGDLALALLPIADRLFEALVPITTQLVDTFNNLIDRLQPTFDALADAVGNLVTAFEPLFDIFGGAFAGLIEGFAFLVTPVIEAFAALTEATGAAIPVVFLLYQTIETLGSARAFKTLAPALFGIIQNIYQYIATVQTAVIVTAPYIAAAAALAAAIGFLIAKSRETPPVFDDVIQSTLATASAITDVEAAVLAYTTALSDYVTESEILKNEKLVEALAETGISIEQFQGFVEGGSQGLNEFLQALASISDGGVLRSYAGGVEYTAEQIAKLTDAEREALFLTRDTTGARNTIADEYNRLTGSYGATNEAAFNLLVTQNQLSDQFRRDTIQAVTNAETGQIDYKAAIQRTNDEIVRQKRSQDEANLASGQAAADLQTLGTQLDSYRQQLALGADSTRILSEATLAFGGDAEAAQKFVDDFTKEVQEFTDTVVGNVPSVIDAFSELSREEGGSFAEISANLDKNLQDTLNWSDTLIRLSEENRLGILQVAAQVGAERTAILLEAYGGDEAELDAHLQRMFAIEENARNEARIAAAIAYASRFGLEGEQLDELAKLLRLKAPWLPITQEDIDAALGYVKDKQPEFETETEVLAQGSRAGWDRGFRGLGELDPANPLADRVQEQGEAAVATAEEQGAAAGTAYVESASETVANNGGVLATNFAVILGNASSQSEFFARLVGIFAGARIIDGLEETLQNGVPSLTQTVNDVLLRVSADTSFASLYTGFVIASGIGRGAYDNRAFIGDELVRGFTYVVENYSDEADMTGWYLGSALAEGLKRGLRDNASSVAQVAAQIIRDAEEAAKAEAETESPSKVWEGIGRDLVNGLARGLERTSPVSDRAAANVIGSAGNVGGGGGGVSNISVTVPVTINGNADPAMGSQIGRAAATELRRVLQLEARMA